MIVTLVHRIPGDCHMYFPTELNYTGTAGEMKITLTAVEETPYVVHRTFSVEDSRTQKTKVVEHYHFTGWQDWQLPEGPSRESLAGLVEQAAAYITANKDKQGEERNRLLVHCRAGIGRTGTTISLISSVIAIRE